MTIAPSKSTSKVRRLSPQQLELLQLRLRRKREAEGRGTSGPAPLSAEARREGVFPLSFAQRRLWFLDQLDPDSAAYHLAFALELRGPLQPSLLRRAFQVLLERHSALRTVFIPPVANAEEVEARQHILPSLALPVAEIDLQHLSEVEKEEQAACWIQREGTRPFDLAKGPLLRAFLLRLEAQKHALVLVCHHIVGDGLSLAILERELLTLYLSLRQGGATALPPLPLEFVDFASWQRQRLVGEVLARELAFWQERMEGAPPLLELPADHPRPSVPSGRGGSEELVFEPSLVVALGELARSVQGTLFTALTAGMSALLGRLSGSSDIVLGTPVSGRTHSQVEGLVGLFINNLVLRIQLEGNSDVPTFLDSVRDVVQEASAHQELPFDRLVEELQPERSLAHTPLFQVLLALQPGTEVTGVADLELRHLPTETGAAKFDLSLMLSEFRLPTGGSALRGTIRYSRDLFDASTIVRFKHHFLTLLRGMDRGSRVSELPLLRPAERTQLLVEWRQQPRAEGQDLLFQQRVMAQAEQGPEAVAVVCGEDVLTFGELCSRATHLAHGLAARGVGPEVVVGVAFEPSVEMVVALLGVLESGGAYLPLDPTDPRRDDLLAETRAPVLLLADPSQEALEGVEVLTVAAASSAAAPRGGLQVPAPHNLAYILYTSGSTGRPKGVQTSRRSLSNYLRWAEEELLAEHTVPVINRILFDASHKQLFLPLLRGLPASLLKDETIADPASLMEAIIAARQRAVNIVPSLWEGVVGAMELGQAAVPTGLERVIFGAEELSQDLVDRTRELLPGVRIDNTYGPTEITSNASWTEVGVGAVDLGRPAAGASFHVLDSRFQPCPIGVVGELVLGGAGLARGYLQRPALTAERFVPDTFGDESGARLYRTGDRVRFLPNGSLAFAGRLDDQIKVRGLRIEPGEIEAALRSQPTVAEAVVVASGEAGDRQLVAWLTAVGDAPPEAAQLRQFLGQRLPSSLVPAAFPVLPKMPRTATGKLDRGGLAQRPVERESVELGGERVLPRNATERHLVEAFEQVLGVPVGIDDDFFALGGHSLAALRVIARLRRQHGMELPLRSFFERSSVRALAMALPGATRGGAADSSAPAPPPLEAVREGGNRAPLSFAQQRLWFLDRLESGNPAYNVPQALRLDGNLDLDVLARAFTEVVRRHAVLRTVFPARGEGEGEPVQEIQKAKAVLPPLIDLSELHVGLREEEFQRLAEAEALRPFDLSQGPLLRVRVVRLMPQGHGVLLNQHHIVSDAWSTGILVRELMTLYEALSAGFASPLLELPVQYHDFARWQRRWLQGDVLEGQLKWWCEQLAGAPPVLDLATDRPRGALTTYRGRALTFELEPRLSQDLEAMARSHGSSLFMVLLTAFSALLSRHSGQRDLVVGSTAAGRQQTELEEMVGFFINTLALRIQAKVETLEELLAGVRETTLGAWAHQDLPFEKLVERLHPERQGGRSPLFQVVLQLLNAPRTTFEMPGLAVQAVELPTTTAKFDQVLNFAPSGEGLTGLWIYNSDLFDHTTIRRMQGHLVEILHALATGLEQRLEDLALLSAAEHHQLLVEWGGEGQEESIAETLHGSFELWARRTPAALAVTWGGEGLTYEELDHQAERWAGRLRALGVGPEVRVALCLGRSMRLPMAILAVLKAGGAYVPLDPDYPAERLNFLLQDSRAALLLSEEAHVPSNLPAGLRCLCFDRTEDLPQEAVERRQGAAFPSPRAENAAYVIYTSGSTGVPKGVVVTHGQVQRLFATSARFFGFGTDDVWTLFHSYAFDFSVWELWGALGYGGRLVIVPFEVSRSPVDFYRLLVAEQVTVLNQTPSAFYPLIRAQEGVESAEHLSLRWVIFGGEALDVPRLAPWFERHGDRSPHLVNMYGITETTVHVTLRPLSVDDLEPGVGSPLGLPLGDLSLHLLDRQGNPAPMGAAGEICVGGAGVSRGYFQRPALTAERFTPDPFHRQPGARLYRSGDRARFCTRGELESLGRIDHQVKVRGFRIELGEIESALGAHPDVAECVVVLHQGEDAAPPQLVAYVVAEGESKPTARALREDLSQHLPNHMVPALFQWLEALPLTVHGKVDRGALPALTVERPQIDSTFDAPRDALEELLAGLWQETLGLERVGVNDDFFELGGDSIRGAILINRVQQLLDEIVHVVVIFDAPSVAELAAYLRHHYPEAVARWCGIVEGGAEGPQSSREVEEPRPQAMAASERGVNSDSLVGSREMAQFRSLIEPLPPLLGVDEGRPKNPPALFILSPPRSGTTLLRVLLGGHSRLFAPPELELLSFNTMAERAAAYRGRDRFWLEGTQRAVMELWGEDAEAAERRLEEAASGGMSCGAFYGALQERLGERILVDKTPSYSLDPATLQRAEEDFREPLYIHLLRHPQGMISSFEEARLEQIFFRRRHPFSRRQLAELIWLASHQNILRFLETVPAERHHRVTFEHLVKDPERVLGEVCEFLRLPFEGRMLAAYEEKEGRMTDGIRAESKMLGDVKFHQHRKIDPAVAERFKEDPRVKPLGPLSGAMARSLGYDDAESGRAGGEDRLVSVPRRAEQVSFAQERLWFLYQLDPEAPVYNIPLSLDLRGKLEVSALRWALGQVVERHEVLRSTFATEGGQPRLRVQADLPTRPAEVDLSSLPRERRRQEGRKWAQIDALRPFDLMRGPVLRAILLRFSRQEHGLLLNLHHIAADGWSLGVLVREFVTTYRALLEGDTPRLPSLPIQYADYAAWQRQWLHSPSMESELAWWRQHLGQEVASLELPTDFPRPTVQSFHGATRRKLLLPRHGGGSQGGGSHGGGSNLDALQLLSRDEGCTRFMVLLALFQALLHRYTGQGAIAVGSPIAGRNRPQVENLIGFFVNTLVLTAEAGEDPPFRAFLDDVRVRTLGAFSHQDLPFEKLVEALQPERRLNHQPLVQVMFTLQNAPQEALEMPGLEVRSLDVPVEVAKFDLTLVVSESEDGLLASLNYNTGLFAGVTIDRMLGHLHVLLTDLLATPELRLSQLALHSVAERHQLLEWNDTASPYPHETGLPELFTARARRTPEAMATCFSDGELTYGQLDRRANALAYELQRQGVGPEVCVGLAVDRSAAWAVAILAVLKAGGAYVPLDASYPTERLRFIVLDSACRLLLSDGSLPDLEVEGVPVVRMPPVQGEGAAEALEGPQVAVTGAHLAYVIYTSGSTGHPKGVAVVQRAVSRLVLGTDYVALGPGNRIGQLSNAAFDAATFEIWGALLNGGCLVGIPKEVMLSAEDLEQALRREEVDTIFITTALFAQLVLASSTVFSSLRAVIFGGEVVDPAVVRKMRADAPSTRTIHAYGPTESTTFALCQRVEGVAPEALTVPIGLAIKNTTLQVLGAKGEPVVSGVGGELLLGGDGLARGYFKRPALTAQQFVPDGSGMIPGARLYRTGDLVHHRADGAIEFRGRLDHQVKLRGFRIEMGEIETALRAQAEVREGLVLVREDTPGDRRLVAYVTLEEGDLAGAGMDGAAFPAALRQRLGQKLPDYMVPAAVVLLEAFPLTPNGKVDRRALPVPEEFHGGGEGVGTAPRTPTEELLLEIWSDILGVPVPGVEAHFFDLGGHSLLATRLVSRVRDVLGVELPLGQMFETPTPAGLAEFLEGASSGEGSEFEIAAIARPAAERGLPLSFAQRRLWFLDRLVPDTSFYNVFHVVRLRGHLDVPAIQQAVRSLVARHEILRTSFLGEGDGPRQFVADEVFLPVPQLDLRGLPKPRREGALGALASRSAHRPHQLSKGPLLRMEVVHLEDHQHALLLNLHHIVTDGWSMGILYAELTAFYEAFLEGRPPSLAPLPLQYGDFSLWQEQWLAGERLEALLTFWRRQLATSPRALELPFDRPRPVMETFRGRTESMRLQAPLAAALRRFGRRQGTTASMTLLAGFSTLLHRLAGQANIPVGVAVANRRDRKIEGLIGFFVNTLVIPTCFRNRPSFAQLAERVRETSLAAYEHQDLPFDRLVEELGLERDLSRNPLCQVMFGYQNFPHRPVTVRGLTLEPMVQDRPERGSAKFDLSLFFMEEGEELLGTFEYNSDLFDRSTVLRLVKQFERLLTAVTAQPDEPVAEISLLSPAASQQLLEWNDTASLYPREAALAELFDAQVQRTPHALALNFADGRLTYGQLDRRANALAHQLHRQGVGPEVCVGLAVERSAAWVVSILAILKAGGAYVPLDSSYPPERLQFMVQDSGCHLLLSDGSLPEITLQDVPQVMVHNQMSRDAAEASEGPSVAVDGDHLAYVMYTSGSTGRPKGVAVVQRAVSRLVLATDYVVLGPGDRVGQVSNAAFDAATFEIWGALLNGGCLVEVPKEVLLSPGQLEDVLRRERVDTIFMTAALFSQHVLASSTVFSSLREVMFGGEAADPSAVRKLLRDAPATQGVNGYGPTESTTFAVCHRVDRLAAEALTVPIGRPIKNTTAEVVGPTGVPVTLGVAGELRLGGDGLARGYVNRPALTARQFVPDGLSKIPGARLYRTGDLVRHRVAGVIEFQGRFDHQVKLRGFRIELGEIEAVLGAQPEVRECTVMVREDSPGDHRLVAYAVMEEEALTLVEEKGALPSQLRQRLAKQLPEYMVPAATVLLQAFPLTPNGKLDRRALPAPDLSKEHSERKFLAPRTPFEAQLAVIWSEVLGLERVGIDEDFFALGGHSLLATQVVSRVQRSLGVELPLRTFFEGPTVAELAVAVVEGRGAVETQPLVPRPRGDVLPLSFAQERLWFLERLVPQAGAYNIPSTIELSGEVEEDKLAAALDTIRSRHESLRTTFVQRAGRPAQVIAPFTAQGLAVVDLQGLEATGREKEAQQLVAGVARASFDLEHGPLLRSVLLRLGPERRLLTLNMHHIVSDGWSMGILFDELTTSYGALVAGQKPDLAPLPIQTVDFAIWQRQWLRGEVLERQINYWKERLVGAPEALELPADRVRPPQPSYRGRALPVRLDEELSQSLNQLSRRCGVTFFMTLLGGFYALLGRHLGRQDLVVGSPISNRHHFEVEGLIGFFVNSLVLRADLSGNPSTETLLSRVAEVTLGAYDHQDLPFETLVGVLQPRRDLSRHPLFQVFFQLMNAPAATATVNNVRLKRIRVATQTSKFDFNLALAESAGALVGELGYSLDLYDATTMERLVGNYRTLLAAMAARPEQPLATLPLLERAAQQQVLLEWALMPASPVEIASCSLQERVARRAAQQPEAIALVVGNEWLSYGQLLQQAQDLAAILRRQGVGPEVPVGICLERTAALPVSILGVLLAGGIYVPMDPAYPVERLRFMLEDSGASRVLTTARGRQALPELAEIAIDLDPRTGLPATWAGAEQRVAATSTNLALMIYTSGSTGRPKGVAITHRGALTLLDWAQGVYGVEDLAGVFAATSINFDLSVFELFATWNQGGTVILGRNALALGELPARQRVTLINTVPSALTELLRREQVPNGVRVVNLAGEPLPGTLVRQAMAHGSISRVFNLYGPSEDTTYSTAARVDVHSATPPIGRPLAGKAAYLLDRKGRPVGPGMIGELYLGGSGLARGYWRRPGATAERFVPNPFSGPSTRGERLYRTGDLARFLADGSLNFLGRFDDQVKVRGYRIELGEIERHLEAHSAVEEARVLARGDLGSRRLVAWVVPTAAPDSETTITADRLRSALGEQIPGYMVPSDFVFLEALPRLPNGKLNRRALRDPEGERPALEVAYQAPVGELEATIVEVLQEVLNIDKAGRADNFFDLGGHSLLMVEVQTQLSERLGRPLPVLELFRHPTVQSLGEFLAGSEEAASSFAERTDRQEQLNTARQRRTRLRQARRGRRR